MFTRYTVTVPLIVKVLERYNAISALFGKFIYNLHLAMNLIKSFIRRAINNGNPEPPTFERLEELVVPLIKTASTVMVLPESVPPDNSQMRSHFGGQPYFEKGESWPVDKKGNPLQFVCQIFNEEGLHFPDEVKLVQLFYDFNSKAYSTEDDGWFVKIYGGLDLDRVVKVDRPKKLIGTKYCELKFEEVKSLPDWEGIDIHDSEAAALSAQLDQSDGWAPYEKTSEKLIGKTPYRTQIGGYPKWVQGEETPILGDNLMDLLLQVDCEENAGVFWGNLGMVYIFYDLATKKIEFIFQSH